MDETIKQWVRELKEIGLSNQQISEKLLTKKFSKILTPETKTVGSVLKRIAFIILLVLLTPAIISIMADTIMYGVDLSDPNSIIGITFIIFIAVLFFIKILRFVNPKKEISKNNILSKKTQNIIIAILLLLLGLLSLSLIFLSHSGDGFTQVLLFLPLGLFLSFVGIITLIEAL